MGRCREVSITVKIDSKKSRGSSQEKQQNPANVAR